MIKNNISFNFILGLIVVFAFLIRIWGVDFGLPYEYHVDEVQYVRQAASMGENGLEPAMWNNPPLFKYLLLVEYGLAYIIGKIIGAYSSPSAFGAIHSVDPSLLYLLARGTNALFGALTVVLIGLAGKKIFNKRVGLLAAWFLAVSFIHVRDSHFAVNDILATMFMFVVIYASLHIYLYNSYKWHIIAGIGLGLGFSTKYTALLAIVPLILAYIFHLKDNPGDARKNINKLFLGFFVAGCSSILTSPFFVFSAKDVLLDIYSSLYLPGKLGFDGWEISSSGGYVYFMNSILWGLGWGMSLLILLGIFVGIIYRPKEAIILLSLPVLLYIFMGRQQMYFARFIIPAIPPVLLWSAKILDMVVKRWVSGKTQFYVLIVLSLAFTFQPLMNSIKFDRLLTRDDTRTLAKIWIEDNIPNDSKIALDWPFYGPPLSTGDVVVPYSKNNYEIEIVEGSGLDMFPLSWYKNNGFDYLVTSSFIHDINLVSKEKQKIRLEFYSSLDNELTKVMEFAPGQSPENWPFIFDEIYGPAITLYKRDYPGPLIRIYRFDD